MLRPLSVLLVFLVDSSGGYFSKRLTNRLNLFGKSLEECSFNGTAEAGYPGGSRCIHYPMDTEGHNICISLPQVTGGDFCELTNQQGCHEPGLCTYDRSSGNLCNVSHYCVTEGDFATYVEKEGCGNVGPVYCEATNMMAILDYEELIQDDDFKAADALDCIKEKCKLL